METVRAALVAASAAISMNGAIERATAAYVKVMAPGTNLGPATPMQIGGPAMTERLTKDAIALIRSLAELRGCNADWAELAVREAKSLSANTALQVPCRRDGLMVAR